MLEAKNNTAKAKQINKSSSSSDFASQMKELEDIATYLESSEVKLDEAIEKYERGIKIAKQLQEYIRSAENKVESLKQSFDS